MTILPISEPDISLSLNQESSKGLARGQVLQGLFWLTMGLSIPITAISGIVYVFFSAAKIVDTPLHERVPNRNGRTIVGDIATMVVLIDLIARSGILNNAFCKCMENARGHFSKDFL